MLNRQYLNTNPWLEVAIKGCKIYLCGVIIYLLGGSMFRLFTLLFIFCLLTLTSCFDDASTAPESGEATSISDSLFVAIQDSIMKSLTAPVVTDSLGAPDTTNQNAFQNLYQQQLEKVETYYDSLIQYTIDSLAGVSATRQQEVLDSLRNAQSAEADSLKAQLAVSLDSLQLEKLAVVDSIQKVSMNVNDSIAQSKSALTDSLNTEHIAQIDSLKEVVHDSLYTAMYSDLYTQSASNYVGVNALVNPGPLNPTLYEYYDSIYSGLDRYQRLATVYVTNFNDSADYEIIVEAEIMGLTYVASEMKYVSRGEVDVKFDLAPVMINAVAAKIIEVQTVPVEVRAYVIKNDAKALIYKQSFETIVEPPNTWSSQYSWDHDGDSLTAPENRDYSEYLVAWTQQNSPSLDSVIDEAVYFSLDTSFLGYQTYGSMDPDSISYYQVQALYIALQNRDIHYINSVFSLTGGQQVKFPNQTLRSNGANCIDGTVLFASLLKEISIDPIIVLIPGHSFIGWKEWDNSDTTDWSYVETTMTWDDTNYPFNLATWRADSLFDYYYHATDSITVIDVNAVHKKGILPFPEEME